jgi:hypothetical protein
MRGSIRYFLPFLGLCFVGPVFATDTHNVKCAVNQERVWVYESLNSFDVEAKLKCGESVEILSRVKGFVKIRTANGVDGYVPDSAFSDLPPLPDDANPAASGASPLLAASIAAHTAAASSGSSSASTVSNPAPAPVAVRAKAPNVEVPKELPREALQPAAIANSPAVSPRDAVATAARPAKASAPVRAEPPVNAPAPALAKVSTVSVVAKPASPAAVEKPAKTAVANNSVTPPSPSNTHLAASMSNSSAAPAKSPVATVAPVSARIADSTTSAAPANELATTQPAAPAEESEDYPDAKPENESADPSCRVFFSGYGLAPSQFKWLADNRRKEHSEICPAPDLGRVDYVILFAHDSDTYSGAMPTLVHTDRNGFSDFNPMTTVDTTLMPASEVEKARYEFVWVFRMKRGDFDPARFSQRRRPQFTTYVKGSHASARAVEDAFSFIQEQSPNR